MGMINWGRRQRRCRPWHRFLSRHVGGKHEHGTLEAENNRKGKEKSEDYDDNDEQEQSEQAESEGEDDDDWNEEQEEEEEEEEEEGEKNIIVTTEKAQTAKKNLKRKGQEAIFRAQRARISERQNKMVGYKQRQKSKKKVLKNSIHRWSVERYKLAEENMLTIMKEKRAVFGKPMLRPVLRSEARKLIGDTGLLDHLLKHMSGKVAPGGKERFRRRPNEDGAMEYWLESADLVDIRREAGVQDPYWIPPHGWKRRYNPTQDPTCAREIRKLKEMSDVKKKTKGLVSKKKEEEVLPTMTFPVLRVADQDSGNDALLLRLKGIYMDLEKRKVKIEKQLMEISQTLIGMEEQMGKLLSTMGVST